ncbi:hypothetical protein DFAR_3710015 [Desulfarculales bacterium]
MKRIAPDTKTLAPVFKTLMTLGEHAHLTLSRWTFNNSTARLEGLNGIFQAARARTTGYRNVFTFMTMIYFHRRTTGGTHQIPQVNDEEPACDSCCPLGPRPFRAGWLAPSYRRPSSLPDKLCGPERRR